METARWYISSRGWASHRAKTNSEEKGKGRYAESFVQVWLREIEERSKSQRVEVMKGKRTLEISVSTMVAATLAIEKMKARLDVEAAQTPPDLLDSRGNSPMLTPTANIIDCSGMRKLIITSLKLIYASCKVVDSHQTTLDATKQARRPSTDKLEYQPTPINEERKASLNVDD
jgi:hypothetical protein